MVEVMTWSPGSRCQPEYRQIVGFRTAAGKHDLRGAAAQQRGHRFARALDRGPRLLPVMVDGGRVAEVLAEVRPHGLQNLGEHRSGRVVVEIDSAHHAFYCTDVVVMFEEECRVGLRRGKPRLYGRLSASGRTGVTSCQCALGLEGCAA